MGNFLDLDVALKAWKKPYRHTFDDEEYHKLTLFSNDSHVDDCWGKHKVKQVKKTLICSSRAFMVQIGEIMASLKLFLKLRV